MANFMSVLAARTTILPSVRDTGLFPYSRLDDTVDHAATSRLRVYTSETAHCCVSQALDMSGLGRNSLRLVPKEVSTHRMDCAALRSFIAADAAAGLTPLMIIGTAGTVDVGAIDDLDELATIAAEQGIWFHVDGALGALGVLSQTLRPLLIGIERADSIAFDFHKWAQVQYDAGFIMMRNGLLLKQTFSTAASYLSRSTRGLNSGDWWPCDYGPDLSRSCRAIKTWFSLKVHGTAAIGACMDKGCALARLLASMVGEHPELELLAPVALNIVCFRFHPPRTRQQEGNDQTQDVHVVGSVDREIGPFPTDEGTASVSPWGGGSSPPTSLQPTDGDRLEEEYLDRINSDIVACLHEEGLVAPSVTRINGRIAVRAAFVNHRTTRDIVHTLVAEVLRLGKELDEQRRGNAQ